MIKFLLYNRVVKFFYGILLLPLCYTLLQTLIFVISKIEFSNSLVQYFIFGVAAYIIIHFGLYKPIRIYVIGHELVHMISAYLCGSNVKKFKIGSNYGSVNVDKVNTFIALSPYFIPLYSIIVVLLWSILKYVFKLQVSTQILSFLLGLTLTFHIVLTVYAIYLGQQDLKISGWLFSVVLIFMLNCIILVVLFNVMFLPYEKVNMVKTFFFDTTILTYKHCYTVITKLIKIGITKLKQG